MVVSQIDKRINFRELKSIQSKDVKKELELYQIEIYEIEIVIAIGSPNKEFEDKNVIYFPIYLVNRDNKVLQIGVYEIKANSFIEMYDDKDELLIDRLSDGLIFSFVNKKFLMETRLKPDYQINDYDKLNEEDEEENEEIITNFNSKNKKIYKIPANRENLFNFSSDASPQIEMLKEESKEDAKQIRSSYKESIDDLWIQKCMKNSLYNIKDVESNGDCFFATIRDSFASIGQSTTVLKLRKRLSEELDESVFENYLALFTDYDIEMKANKVELTKVNKRIKELNEKMNNTIDIEEKRGISESVKILMKDKKRITDVLKVITTSLNDYKFMKGIQNINDLRAKILKSDFWADAWSVFMLEYVLNVKFILLSSEAYNDTKDSSQVLNCGEIHDKIKENGTFEPEFYIMLEFTGNHYKIITYKNKSIFKFNEVPYDIKTLVLFKCMERNSGPYSYIPEFVEFKSQFPSVQEKEGENVDVYNTMMEESLYSDDIVFSFHGRSPAKNAPLPGKGNGGETIPAGKEKEFSTLHGIDKWRNKLTNMWQQEFVLDNHRWNSVDHYYQASKFKKENPQFYISFALESGTELSKDPAMAKEAGGKTGKIKGKLLRPANVKQDADFEGPRSKRELYDAQYAKFSQNEDLKVLLLATKNAKLTHWVRGSPNVVFTELMRIREVFLKENR